MEKEKATTTVEIDKDLFLRFKSLCVLKETTMSEEIEKLVGDWVDKNKNTAPKSSTGSVPTETESGKSSGSNDVEDDLEKQTEGDKSMGGL